MRRQALLDRSRSPTFEVSREVASMKARLICLIRQHRWHRNDNEYPTVWTCERCGKTKVDSGSAGDARSRSDTRPWFGDGGAGGSAFGGGDGPAEMAAEAARAKQLRTYCCATDWLPLAPCGPDGNLSADCG